MLTTLLISSQAFSHDFTVPSQPEHANIYHMFDSWMHENPGCKVGTKLEMIEQEDGNYLVNLQDQVYGVCMYMVNPNPRSYVVKYTGDFDCYETYASDDEGDSIEIHKRGICLAPIIQPKLISFETIEGVTTKQFAVGF